MMMLADGLRVWPMFALLLTLSLPVAPAYAHDPGLSYLQACLQDDQLKINWRLHADNIDQGAVAVTVGGKPMTAISHRSSKSGEEIVGHWTFNKVSRDFLLELPQLPTMAHGHRVLAQACSDQHRAVLSRMGPRWQPTKTALAP